MTQTLPSTILARVQSVQEEVDDERIARLHVLDWLEEVMRERNKLLDLILEQYNLALDQTTRLSLEVILRFMCHTPAGESLFDEDRGTIREWVP